MRVNQDGVIFKQHFGSRIEDRFLMEHNMLRA